MEKQSNTEIVAENEFTIDYEKFTLDNGLEVILHKDDSDPIVAVGTIMHVGSNREKVGKTGFAHFFEHMSFNDSENVPVGASRKLVPEWGGSRNGGTWSDGTIYYEVVPKDAFEKILWMDSDRLGYMINTVTESALNREKQVVKNEKRQRVDNAPYGFTGEIIKKNLYPKDHPYNWTVIGSLPDLQAATLDDVKEFYNDFYGAANATLVIAGDIDIEETKVLVDKWFGEIRKGPTVEIMPAMPVNLESSPKVYFEDNFAKLPEIRMVFPSVENYNKDIYALNILGQLLSGSKTAPLFKSVVEEAGLAPGIGAFQSGNELAGEFIIRCRGNNGSSLNDIHTAILSGLERFEAIGFTDSELDRVKAELETSLYRGVETVLNKAFRLAIDNEFNGDPAYLVKEAKLTNEVTRADIMRVFNQYVYQRNAVITSVIPKGQLDLIVEGSSQAEVYQEEIVSDVENEEVSQGEEAVYVKTPSSFPRDEPDFSSLPLVKSPAVWESSASTGMKIMGVENAELPLVNFDITIPGGQLLDPMNKIGVSNLFTDLLLEGTANKTPAELEQAIGLLGASIFASSGREEMRIVGSCLSKNYEATMALVTEILTQPRWDKKEYSRLKQALDTQLKGREANPAAISSLVFNQLLYGKDHMFAYPVSGTVETASNITLDDVKSYYNNLSLENATMHVVGAVTKDRVESSLRILNSTLTQPAVELPKFAIAEQKDAGKLFFIDVPGSKQSVIRIGKLALSGTDENHSALDFANEILGGGSSGRLFQTLRIEKGYTYGARSGIGLSNEVAPFQASSSVRANASLPSLEIMRDMISSYGPDFTQEDVDVTKNKIMKANTRAFEGLNSKLGLLRTMSKFNKKAGFIEEEQDMLMDMSLADFKEQIATYLQEEEMIYLVVGDGDTQRSEVEKLGKEVIDLDIFGNPSSGKVSN